MDAFEELFNAAKEPRTEKEMVRAYLKVQALEACESQHTELMKCYQQRWFPECSKQQTAFWACYKEINVKLRKKHNVYY